MEGFLAGDGVGGVERGAEEIAARRQCAGGSFAGESGAGVVSQEHIRRRS